MWVAVVDQTVDGRIAKFSSFNRQADAQAHVDRVADRFPSAFVAEAPEGGVPDWKVVDGALVHEPIPAREPSRREKLKNAYIMELGETPGDVIETIGDVLDDVIREVRALAAAPATPEFKALIDKVDAIKARFPKK